MSARNSSKRQWIVRGQEELVCSLDCLRRRERRSHRIQRHDQRADTLALFERIGELVQQLLLAVIVRIAPASAAESRRKQAIGMLGQQSFR